MLKIFCLLILPLSAAELPDIRSIPADLEVPALSEGPPAPGKRVRHGLSVLYLPTDWKAGLEMPVIVELAGNGGYTNKFGDVSTELPEAYLRPLLPNADLTFLSTGFRNHNDSWILLPSPAREKAREWLQRVTSSR